MTGEQFDALATLLRLRQQAPSRAAARRVLVDDLRQADAAALEGVSPAALGNALRRLRRGLELANIAVARHRPITSEMISAGVFALESHGESLPSHELAEAVYRAMAKSDE